jgi:hypothetical protein
MFQPNPIPESTTFRPNLVSKPARFQPNLVLKSTASAQIQQKSPGLFPYGGIIGPKTDHVSVQPGTRIDHLPPKPGIKTRQILAKPGTRIGHLMSVPSIMRPFPPKKETFSQSKLVCLRMTKSCPLTKVFRACHRNRV